MKFWNRFPLYRLIFPFILGIVAGMFLDYNFKIPLYVFIVLIFISAIITFFYKHLISYRFRWLGGLFVYLSLLFFGYEITSENNKNNNPLNFNDCKEEKSFFVANIIEPLEQKENSNKTIVRIKSVKNENVWSKVDRKAIVYFEKDSISSQLDYGDCLLINVNFNEVKSPRNPSEFNYKRYLSNKQIFYQAYLKSENWEVLSKNNGFIIKSLSIKLREKFLNILQENEISGKEYAVTSALLLGYREKLDADLIKEFSGAGAMHILCVSGLHVGIIFVILNWIFGFLNKKKIGKIFKAIVLILLIWVYAAITGMAPSVLRASTMFSFVIIGQALKRHTNIYNSLAASAFLLLLINPYIITEVGFQLSYIAVISIVALQPPLYKLWVTKIWILDKAWQIITVSIAAQIGTFPLAMFYFHQFPNYFMLTNLIVIPLVGAIIYVGIAVIVTSPLGWLSWVVAKILFGLVWFLNFSVKLIEGLPGSTWRGISLTNYEMILFFIIIGFIIMFFIKEKVRFMRFAIISSILLCVSFAYKNYNRLNQRQFIVYNVNKNSAYDFIDGKKDYFFADSLMMNDKKKHSFNIQNNWCNSGLKENVRINLSSEKFAFQSPVIYFKNNFLQFYDKRLVIVNEMNFKYYSSEKIKVDYIIISQNVDVDINDLVNQYEAEQIIFDSSNSFWRVNRMIEECKTLGLKYYSVLDEGAFVVDV